MNLKLRMAVVQFFQFFIWGSWMMTIGAYWFQTKHWSGTEFGAIYSTMGLGSLLMPSIMGVIADRWINAERLYSACHLICAAILFCVPMVNDPTTMFWVMLLVMCFYMPTIALSITVFYTAMADAKMDIVREYPPIRMWGTVGFAAAMWLVSLLNLETSAAQFYVASIASLFLGLYGLTMPPCLPLGKSRRGSLASFFGFDAFVLFKDSQMVIFFIFAMLLGASLQLTNAYGDAFLHDFSRISEYKGSIAVTHPAIIMSISQVFESIFLLLLPFLFRYLGMRKMMMLSMFAWIFRFGLLAYGDPGDRLWMIIVSCMIYGLAFDFNVVGSMFVQGKVEPGLRASSQGLYMMMTNGLGAFLGSRISGWAIDKYFMIEGHFDWHRIWLSFAFYSLVVFVLFVLLFREPDEAVALHGVAGEVGA